MTHKLAALNGTEDAESDDHDEERECVVRDRHRQAE